MADEKKKDKGAEAVIYSKSDLAFFAVILIFVFLALGGTAALGKFDLGTPLQFLEYIRNSIILAGVDIITWFGFFSVGSTVLLSSFIVILFFKMDKIGTAEYNKYYPPEAQKLDQTTNMVAPIPKNKKWESVMQHMASDKPNDWKVAILEADIMLGELLEYSGYHGESIGEMLKTIEKSDFLTLDNAWEAHKVRNMIAHEGQDFILTEREARRVIELYKTVFEEFAFI